MQRTTTARRGTLVVAVLAALLLAAGCEAPYQEKLFTDLWGTPAPEATTIGCDQAASRIAITAPGSYLLDPSCTYGRSIDITASDVVLDCRGAQIISTTTADARGIAISAPVDTDLADVTVRNCFVKGFLNNIRVTRPGFKTLVPGSEYDHGTSNIVLEHNHLYASRGSGIFVDGFVRDVTIRSSEIAGSGSVGIYLEAGSKDNEVSDNLINDNGYADVDPVNGKPFTLNGTEYRYLSTGREGIAIDGSRHNRILRNTLYRNSYGGIFLYKNCGEYFTEKPAQWWQRNYGAEGNLIEGNRISAEPNGVWVGSRMAENQLFMDCSDPVYYTGNGRRIVVDRAADNTVRNNIFERVDYGVRVEDDNTLVTGNQFANTSPTAMAVLVGTQYRTTELAQPVSGTTVTGNQASIANNPSPYAWIHGEVGTTFSGNLSYGSPATLDPGTQPRINPFLFVVKFWLP